MRFPNLTATFLLAGLFLAPLLRADTLILKDGTEIEGRILEETDTHVRIEVQVSKSIRDAKLVPRADILEVTKEAPDSGLYAEMQAVLPSRDRMDVSDYEKLLTLYPRRFATEYPSSPLLPKVREFQKKLEDEMAKVASGSVKLDGKWISPEEIARDPYNHEAKILAADMMALAAKGDLTGTLQKFELLEAHYPYSTAISAAFAPALKAIDAYDSSIKRALREIPIKLAEREKQLTSLDPQGRQAAQESFARELQTFQKDWEAARAAKAKWLPVSVWDKKSLTEATKSITTEKTRLAKIDPAARARAAALLAVAFTALADGKFEAAELQLKQAAEAGVDSKTVTALRAQFTAAQAAAAEAADAPPAEPAPESPFATQPEAAPAPAEKSDPPPAAEPEAPKPAKPGPAKTGSDPPVKKGTARDFSGLVDGADNAEKAKAQPAISFRTILFILIGVMVAITVLVKVFAKPAPEDFEEARPEDRGDGNDASR